jgi:MerR HTH family regulatory protein
LLDSPRLLIALSTTSQIGSPIESNSTDSLKTRTLWFSIILLKTSRAAGRAPSTKVPKSPRILFDILVVNVYTYGQMNTSYSTAEVARAIEVSKKTLLRWLYSGKLPEPKHETFGGVESRVWTAADLARAKQFREQHYRKRS